MHWRRKWQPTPVLEVKQFLERRASVGPEEGQMKVDHRAVPAGPDAARHPLESGRPHSVNS